MKNNLKWKNSWPAWLGCAWFGVLMGLRGEVETTYARMALAGPPSPALPHAPVPAIVVMFRVLASTFRTRS